MPTEYPIDRNLFILKQNNSPDYQFTRLNRDRNTSSTINQRRQLFYSRPRQIVLFDKNYITKEKLFNHHFQTQLTQHKNKFYHHYDKCIQKLTPDSEKYKSTLPSYKSNRYSFQNQSTTNHPNTHLSIKFQHLLNQRLVKSQHQVFEETFHKVSERDQSTQLSVQPLRFQNKYENHVRRRRSIEMMILDDCQQINQERPSSRKTIINELDDLQERK